MLEKLIAEMITYYRGDPKRIQHFMKVHNFAKTIAVLEEMEEQQRFILETAAVVHDIGIKVCEEKYGNCSGSFQELEGPALAETLLSELGFSREVIQRVSYLVGHHHTYKDIDGLDYQILVEADFLVNLYEDNSSRASVELALKSIFRTDAGISICRDMFDL